MYREPYIKPSAKYQNDIKKLTEKIEEEKTKENADKHKILRLEEQKIIQHLFSDEFGGTYTKYASPY